MEEDKDAVSAMQESVDQLALSMFDSLRLIPFSEVKGVVPQQGAESVVVRRAVATGAAWHNQVQALAEGVLTQARHLDGLIDVLPGAELREDQQMEVCVFRFRGMANYSSTLKNECEQPPASTSNQFNHGNTTTYNSSSRRSTPCFVGFFFIQSGSPSLSRSVLVVVYLMRVHIIRQTV